MDKVRTIKEAYQFFQKNVKDDVLAINKKGEEKRCDCYPEVAKYFMFDKIEDLEQIVEDIKKYFYEK